ncbi:MAG: pilus assembly PilX N-terminal domain-containing protein [bacterium]|nr:pilus assembly PilX N-terminal domain-containing protein [bacterium]
MRAARGFRAPGGLLRAESGLAFLTAIVVMLVMAMLTVAVANLALSEYAAAVTSEQAVQAFFVAEGGLERALAVLRTDPDWSNGLDADAGADGASWQPLNDAAYDGAARDKPFPPPGLARLGEYSIYIRRMSANPGDSINVNSISVRVIGRVGRAARTVEFEARRLTASDFVTYSAQDMLIDEGGGNVTVHGSIYVRGDLGLKAVRTGIYNDRPLFSTDRQPYPNQLYVRGLLDMSSGNPTVGTQTQPMWGVHAERLDLRNDGRQNLWAYQVDNLVPDIPYPDVASYVSALAASGGYGNAVQGSQLVVCREGSASPIIQTDLVLSASGAIFYLPTKAYWTSLLEPKQCDFAPGGVAESANHILKWEPRLSSQPGLLTFNSTVRDLPVLIRGRLGIAKDVVYSGTGTVVVDYPAATAWAMDSGGTGRDPTGAPGSSVTGPCTGSWSCNILARQRASERATCGSSPPTTMPAADLAVFIVNGSVRLYGSANSCDQEINAVIVAGARDDPVHRFLSLRKVQVYGVVMANKLDTSQNPDFFQVPDLPNYLPFPLAQLLGGSGGAVVHRNWKELY